MTKLWDDKNNSKRIQYKNKRFRLTKDYRIGICRICKKRKLKTLLHHTKYFFSVRELETMKLSRTRDMRLIRNTVEMCDKCHRNTHSKR